MELTNLDVVEWLRSHPIGGIASDAFQLSLWENFITSYVSRSRRGFSTLRPAYERGIVEPPSHLSWGDDVPQRFCNARTLPTPNDEYGWTFGYWSLKEWGPAGRKIDGNSLVSLSPEARRWVRDVPVYLRAVYFLTGGPRVGDTAGWEIWAEDDSSPSLGTEFISSTKDTTPPTDLATGFISTEDAGNEVVASAPWGSKYQFGTRQFLRWTLPLHPELEPGVGVPTLVLPKKTSGYAIAKYSLPAGAPEDGYQNDPGGFVDIWGPYRRAAGLGPALVAFDSRLTELQRQVEALAQRRDRS